MGGGTADTPLTVGEARGGTFTGAMRGASVRWEREQRLSKIWSEVGGLKLKEKVEETKSGGHARQFRIPTSRSKGSSKKNWGVLELLAKLAVGMIKREKVVTYNA